MRVAWVIPTVRSSSFREFWAAWRGQLRGHRIYVLDDGKPALDPADYPEVNLIRDQDIDDDLGPDAWIISRRDSAKRSYGFLRAWRDGADLIVTLDDDTRPVPCQDHLAEHRRNLEAMPRWQSSVPGLRPRGMPYGDLGVLADVQISMGLWRGCPDLDAATTLVLGCPSDYRPPEGRWVLPAGTHAPLCGMNLAFTAAAAPLMWFGLQGAPWPVGRFDDIWMGVVARRLCDHLGWQIVAGRPHVEHRRASDPLVSIVKEAAGYARHERFWRLVDVIPLRARTAAAGMAEIGRGLVATAADPYFARVGQGMVRWAAYFDDKVPPDHAA